LGGLCYRYAKNQKGVHYKMYAFFAISICATKIITTPTSATKVELVGILN